MLIVDFYYDRRLSNRSNNWQSVWMQVSLASGLSWTLSHIVKAQCALKIELLIKVWNDWQQLRILSFMLISRSQRLLKRTRKISAAITAAEASTSWSKKKFCPTSPHHHHHHHLNTHRLRMSGWREKSEREEKPNRFNTFSHQQQLFSSLFVLCWFRKASFFYFFPLSFAHFTVIADGTRTGWDDMRNCRIY